MDKNTSKAKIKFINYEYERYSLCHGMLTLKVNGRKMTFGVGLDDNLNTIKGEYPRFWYSGGGIYGNCEDGLYAEEGDWYYECYEADKLPDVIKNNIDEVMEIFNENVPHGCCGGCI